MTERARADGGGPERWTFGEAPLAELETLAAALRELTSTALTLEQPSAELRRVTAEVRAATARLADEMPHDLRPRVGDAPAPDRRVYLDHSREVGAYNPCVPVYELACADDRGEGSVEFPLAYEGPPGIVHGGFLAVFFDCVLQQLNCDLGVAGKTASLAVRYRRPTPLSTRLRVVATRALEGDRIHSRAELCLGDTVLCEAEMTAVAGNRDALPAVSPRQAAR